MNIDPWILTFSAATVIATVWMGFWSARRSKTASDFFVAGRSVSVGWNASAISGEYLSAASFMGVAGMVMSSGYDALWYPVCYACGYLFLLLFIAGPLRRFGAYTIPDFAEGRFDSPLFRRIAVVFVLCIGFFYTMPQMKGAGTTLAYIFPGLPYWVGVVLVGAVITLNVALGGMKGITLVQAVQYWAKMFAISVPVFVLMAVYGSYGKQVGENGDGIPASKVLPHFNSAQDIDDALKTGTANYEPLAGMTARFGLGGTNAFQSTSKAKLFVAHEIGLNTFPIPLTNTTLENFQTAYSFFSGKSVYYYRSQDNRRFTLETSKLSVASSLAARIEEILRTNGISVFSLNATQAVFLRTNELEKVLAAVPDGKNIESKPVSLRARLPDKAPRDEPWLSPFGPLTTKAAKAAAAAIGRKAEKISREVGEGSESREGKTSASPPSPTSLPSQPSRELPSSVTEAAEKAWLAKHEKPLALLYTYSLIIALVCGTAGLPHILVRFYTNPDGVAAKRTTMWVMILIGVFYLFPPVFGVMGRNLLPSLYEGSGAKGTDKVVLELPRILNGKAEKSSRELPPHGKRFPWGSILSGITCAGAFAAFMSTFSGLLVSMTGALAHDIYGRILRPKSTAAERMKMFKICAVIVGAGAMLLGFLVEGFEINKMVGWAFAIAATSYFPLLFLSTWWRGITMKGAATGMLVGGSLSLVVIASTMCADQAAWASPLKNFYSVHPLLRILAEQPAIWALPLALILMFAISKLTAKEVPADIRMKMLVLHAPEKLGLKQEYIQEHPQGH
ncbi:MAG: hypothetical protein QOF48_2179 [Verrucomicrobiota bacterium]|jgi:Na+(H+)/acetate symporter ActP